MEKIRINKDLWPLVESVVIIGTESEANVPNFQTCSWHSRVNQNPPQWGITIDKRRLSLDYIKANNSFSINYPTKKIVKQTDYCGIYSGRKINKSTLFTVFRGEVPGAPMIEECICLLYTSRRG
mgnify:CR=1 FL=1